VTERGKLSMSRANREGYARFCERLGVRFPGPAHLVITNNVKKKWLWREVGQHGAVLDVFVQSRRDDRAQLTDAP
jgi:putative transposase